jgi:2-succinyl-6-hydroxy-2,4-cyclohexadiene-1-carboxylate synthase
MATTVDILGVPHTCELTAPTRNPNVLVFIHGWLLSRHYWQPLIQQLSSTYQCLSYDLRGFGESQPERPGMGRSPNRLPIPAGVSSLSSPTAIASTPLALAESRPNPYSPAAYAQDLAVLLQQLGITNAWLVGHSLGGSIGLWAAEQYADVVNGVICINSGGGIYLKEEFERFRSAGEQLVKLRPSWLCHLPLVDLAMTRMNVARPIARSWGRQRLLDLVAAHPEAALGTLLDSTTEEEVHSLPQVVSRLKQPVYFIAGAEDTIMEPQYVRHLASFHHLFCCCGENVSEISNCGHLAMVEQPQQVAAQVQTILDSHIQA